MNEIDPHLSYTFRPLRIGFCCDKPSAEDIYEISSLNHTLWGGAYNPIIDVSNLNESKSLVREYGCDLLYAFHTASQAVQEFIASFPWLAWLSFRQSLFESVEDINFPTFFDLTSTTLNFIRFGESSKWLRVPREHAAFPYLGLAFGTLPLNSQHLSMDYEELLKKSYLFPVDLCGDSLPEEPVLLLSDLICRGIIHCPIRQEAGIVIGSSLDPDVLRAFWNIRAAGFNASLFDPSIESGLAPWILQQITQVSKENDRPQLRVGAWFLECAGADIPSSLRDLLAPLSPSWTISSTAQVVTPEHGRYLSRVRGTKSKTALPRVGTNSARPFLHFIPEMLQRRWSLDSASHCLLEVSSSAHAEEPRSLTFRPPYMPEANQAMASTLGIWEKDKLRIQLDGISIISRQTGDPVRLQAGFGDEVISNIFAAVGIQSSISDAGRYTDRLVRHMGGLQQCRSFKIPGVRKLIRETTGNSTITASHAAQTIRGHSGKSAELARFANLVLRKDQKLPLSNMVVWDHLLRKKVFLPGSELKCEECSLVFWISIDDLRSTTVCHYCGASLVVGPLLKSNLDWKYRRSPLFAADDTLRGSVPVLLTLLYLHTLFFDNIIVWSASMDLKLSDERKCESDFVIAASHPFNASWLAIGECKTSDEFNENDLSNLRRVRDSFAATGMDVYIVFAKLALFTDDELKLVRSQDGIVRQRLVLLDVECLESGDFPSTKEVNAGDMAGLAQASASHFAF